MALPDPVTIAARAPTPSIVWGKTRFDGYGSEYVDSSGAGYKLVINHNPSKSSNRHYLRVTQNKTAVDVNGLTKIVEASASLALVRPPFGFTDAEMTAVAMLLLDTAQDSEVTFAKLLLNMS